MVVLRLIVWLIQEPTNLYSILRSFVQSHLASGLFMRDIVLVKALVSTDSSVIPVRAMNPSDE